MATLELRGLTRRYEGAEAAALTELDLVVESGELLVLVGPSGCGKSTALRLVAGLDAPDAGTIRLEDRDLANVSPQDRDVAMVFQGYALYPHMTAREIMEFPLKMRGVSRTERAAKVETAAATLGLTRLLGRRPNELSGGERQRVAMGRAIVRSPKVFLFDEPLSNLDAALRTELRTELGGIVRRLGTTSIYVTHDQVEAMTLGDRIAVMNRGRLMQVGTPREVYERPANRFVAGFLGTPKMNLVELARDEDHFVGGGVRLKAPPHLENHEAVVMGIRPEHLAVGSGGATSIPITSGVVWSAEPLGAESYVHVEADGTRWCARSPGFSRAKRGDPLSLGIEPTRLHWFDAKTEARIEIGSADGGAGT